MSWVERARNRESLIIKKKKHLKLVGTKNKMQYSFGVLNDFFNYSAVCI